MELGQVLVPGPAEVQELELVYAVEQDEALEQGQELEQAWVLGPELELEQALA